MEYVKIEIIIGIIVKNVKKDIAINVSKFLLILIYVRLIIYSSKKLICGKINVITVEYLSKLYQEKDGDVSLVI